MKTVVHTHTCTQKTVLKRKEKRPEIQQTFLGREGVVEILESSEKPTLVDKRQQSHTLPHVLLPVQIDFEIRRVEINDGRMLGGVRAPFINFCCSKF